MTDSDRLRESFYKYKDKKGKKAQSLLLKIQHQEELEMIFSMRPLMPIAAHKYKEFN